MVKKGFTLVELLAAVAILSIIATITINISVKKINETKEKGRETLIKSIELAAKSYVIDNSKNLDNFSRNDNIYVTLETLIKEEKFNNSLVDPTTKKALSLQDTVYVTRNENGQINSTYDINQKNKSKIELNGPFNMHIKKGSNFEDPGVLATSSTGSSVTPIVTGTVNINEVGTYVLTYTHGERSITRNIIVYE